MNAWDHTAATAAAYTGSRAASALAKVCASLLETEESARPKLHLQTVRAAALDLRDQLDALADEDTTDFLAEGALRCADLANLAACAAPELPERAFAAAISATHLAAGATRALCALVEAAAGELEGDRAEYALRDARSAAWRADLVVRQVEESSPARD